MRSYCARCGDLFEIGSQFYVIVNPAVVGQTGWCEVQWSRRLVCEACADEIAAGLLPLIESAVESVWSSGRGARHIADIRECEVVPLRRAEALNSTSEEAT